MTRLPFRRAPVTMSSMRARFSRQACAVRASGPALTVSCSGSADVELNGLYGTLLKAGSIDAAPGADAIRTGPSASGTVIVNDGTIDGRIAISAGADARFENSGWLGI